MMSKPIQLKVEFVDGERAVCCRRCGRELTHPKSIECEYGPVCWQKIEVELWIGDVAVPEVHTPNPLIRRKYQNPQRVEPLTAVHRTLDEFFFMEVESHLVEAPIQRAVVAEA